MSAGPLLRFGRVVTVGYIALALILVVFFGSFMWFRGQREEVLALGPVLLAVATCVSVLISLLFAVGRAKEGLSWAFWAFLVSGTALLFILQLVIVDGALFYTDWDASILVSATIDGIAPHADYFSQYPNQLFLLRVFSAIAHLLTDMSYGQVYLALVIGGCVCMTAATFCVAVIARKLRGDLAGIVAFVLAALLVGFSPWMLVPYSDSYGVLCPAIALLLYVVAPKRIPRMLGVAFFGAIGYLIKPTSIFILVAVLVVEVAHALRRGRLGASAWFRPLAVAFAASAIGAAFAFALNAAAITPYQGQLDQDRSLSLTHYLMIGSNYKSNGRWTEEDYAYSSSFDDPSERSAANIERWEERLSDLGPIGVAKLFLRKTLNNYLDGTFWWEGEGLFYREVVGENQALKDFFNIGYEKNWIAGSSQNGTPYFAMAQLVWFVTLLGCIVGILNRKPSNAECVAYASIFAVSMFLVVFECRARYLFLYAPYFTLLATMGWSAVGELLGVRLAVARKPGGAHFK